MGTTAEVLRDALAKAPAATMLQVKCGELAGALSAASDQEIRDYVAVWLARVGYAKCVGKPRASGATQRKGWERRRENEDRVLVNLAPEHHALWKRTRGMFKGSPEERAEQFQRYVEEHGGEVVESLQDEADAKVERMVAQRGRAA